MTGSGQGRTEMVDIGKVGSAGIAGSSGEVVGPGEEVNRVSCTFVPFDVPVKSYGGPMDAALADAVAEVQGWLAEARRIVALPGAGIHTERRIDDFRGQHRLWKTDTSAVEAPHAHHY